MADKQISDLTSASALTDGSLFVLEQAGAAMKANWGMMKNYISPGVAPQYSSSATYNVSDYVIYNDQLYRCTTAITTPESWTAAHWSAQPLTYAIDRAMLYRRSLTNSDDCDDITQTGSYRKDGPITVANYPTSDASRLIVFGDLNGKYCLNQVVIGYRSGKNAPFIYVRSTDNNLAHNWSPWAKISSSYVLYGKTETGNISRDGNGCLENTQNAYYSRSEMLYEVEEGATVIFTIPASQATALDYAFIITYDSTGALIGNTYFSTAEVSDGIIILNIESGCKYIKLETHTDANTPHIETFSLYSDSPVYERYNLNILSSTIGNSLAFVYPVSKDARTSGRLLLPPNYTIDGAPVPLIVYAHGSGSMRRWDVAMNNNQRKLELFQYLANEGFAVFDCYPWTNKHSLTISGGYDGVFSPYNIPNHVQSYLMGIKYVCSRFNVSETQVSLICKSQGGHIGHWAVAQSIFPFKAVCFQAPDITIGRTNMLYEKNARRAFTQYADLDATQTELDAFINTGDLTNASVLSLVQKNFPLFASMQPYAQGVMNGNTSDFYTDLITGPGTSIPQWMQDLGFPATIPYSNVFCPAFASHENYVKKASCPSKFWCAYDDEAVSSYGNYAIYHWMLNGGANVRWRTMAAGTGGHTSMDTSEDAETTSGTTALGIAYADIPVGFTEAVSFIRNCMAD